MKRLLILLAVTVLTAATAGCRCNWFHRGQSCNTACPTGGYAEPYHVAPPIGSGYVAPPN